MRYVNFQQNLVDLKNIVRVVENVLEHDFSPEAQSILKELLEKLAVILTEPYNESLIYNASSVFELVDNNRYFSGNYSLDDSIVRDLGFRILAKLKNLPELYKNKSPLLDYNNRMEKLNELTIQAQTVLQKIEHSEQKLIPICKDIDNKYEVISQYTEKVEAQKNNRLLENIQTIYAEVKASNESITKTLDTLTNSSTEIDKRINLCDDKIKTFEDTNKTYQEAKKKLEALQEQTRVELEKVFDLGTFKEFEGVKQQKDFSAKNWLWATVITILAIFVGAICITLAHQTNIPQVKTLIDLLSFIAYKFSILFPLIGLAIFCIQRFLKESRLAEEYRFKSACALHFRSYMELVNEICTQDVDKEYREFLMNQIQQLFTSPTERIYKDSNPNNPNNFKVVQETLELIFPQLEKLKSLLKA